MPKMRILTERELGIMQLEPGRETRRRHIPASDS